MQIAVLSDIHGNLEAFEAVLDDMQRCAPDVAHVFSLGDIVGYGPDPEACTRLVRERGILSVLGNHELGVIRSKYRKWFNSQSREALKRTCELVSEEMVDWLRTLPLFRVQDDCFFVHGLPPDSALKYVYELASEELPEVMGSVEQPVIFIGHTHDLELISWDGGLRLENECDGLGEDGPLDAVGAAVHSGSAGKSAENGGESVSSIDVSGAASGGGAAPERAMTLAECIGITRQPLEEGVLQLNPKHRYMINVGAVGQPRDGDPRAKYVLWDTETWKLTVRFVEYDVQKTVEKFNAVGMPLRYAERLL